jgi:hypothetical protein
MPCANFQRLTRPIDKARLAELEPQLKSAHEDLSNRVRGALYFPFVFYRPGEVRAAQTYLTKFPAALVALFPELSAGTLQGNGIQPENDDLEVLSSSSDGSLRRLQDSKLRRAVEQHAVREATRYYLDQGATKVEELGKPYDLRVIGLGPERHVEVKGSSVVASAIELTTNEVTHAHNHKPTDLVVVDQVTVRRLANGEYETSGGTLHIWQGWEPDRRYLAPTQYRYILDYSQAPFSHSRVLE